MWKIISGLYLGWSLGANDSANIFGTGVATAMVRYRTAVVLTAVFVIMGAVLEGPKCMAILGHLTQLTPVEAFCSALASAITMTALTVLALPASSSHAIVGAVIGAGILSGSADFSRLIKVVLCWVLTPIGGAVASYLIYRILHALLKKTITRMTLLNRIYTIGIVLAGCYGAYCLGANNVANVTGVYVGAGLLSPDMAAILGGLSIAFGVMTYGRQVMMTVGKGIAPLDPFSALVTVTAGAVTLHVFTQIGVPVSSSQAIIGAVVGIGLVGGMRTVNRASLLKIALGWVFTPIAAGLLTLLLLFFPWPT